jgi:hypothetical protein
VNIPEPGLQLKRKDPTMDCKCGSFSLTEREWTVPSLVNSDYAEELQMILEEIAAVRGVRIKVREKSVRVGFNADHIGTEQLEEAMTSAGFEIAPNREELYRLEIFGTVDH